VGLKGKRVGRKPRLLSTELERIRLALAHSPRDSGCKGDHWTLQTLTEFIYIATGKRFHPGHVSRIRSSLGYHCASIIVGDSRGTVSPDPQVLLEKECKKHHELRVKNPEAFEAINRLARNKSDYDPITLRSELIVMYLSQTGLQGEASARKFIERISPEMKDQPALTLLVAEAQIYAARKCRTRDERNSYLNKAQDNLTQLYPTELPLEPMPKEARRVGHSWIIPNAAVPACNLLASIRHFRAKDLEDEAENLYWTARREKDDFPRTRGDNMSRRAIALLCEAEQWDKSTGALSVCGFDVIHQVEPYLNLGNRDAAERCLERSEPCFTGNYGKAYHLLFQARFEDNGLKWGKADNCRGRALEKFLEYESCGGVASVCLSFSRSPLRADTRSHHHRLLEFAFAAAAFDPNTRTKDNLKRFAVDHHFNYHKVDGALLDGLAKNVLDFDDGLAPIRSIFMSSPEGVRRLAAGVDEATTVLRRRFLL
jgi:hypothetical protein